MHFILIVGLFCFTSVGQAGLRGGCWFFFCVGGTYVMGVGVCGFALFVCLGLFCLVVGGGVSVAAAIAAATAAATATAAAALRALPREVAGLAAVVAGTAAAASATTAAAATSEAAAEATTETAAAATATSTATAEAAAAATAVSLHAGTAGTGHSDGLLLARRVRRHGVLDGFSDGEAAVALGTDLRLVDEHVLAGGAVLDEPEALVIHPPLDGTLVRHGVSLD